MQERRFDLSWGNIRDAAIRRSTDGCRVRSQSHDSMLLWLLLLSLLLLLLKAPSLGILYLDRIALRTHTATGNAPNSSSIHPVHQLLTQEHQGQIPPLPKHQAAKP